MLSEFKYLLRRLNQEYQYIRLAKQQTYIQSGEQLLQETLQQMFNHQQINVPNLKHLFLDNALYYDSQEITYFFKHYFNSLNITIHQFIQYLATEQTISGHSYTPTKPYNKLNTNYNIIQLLSKMMSTALSVKKIKRQFRMNFDIQQLWKNITKNGTLSALKLKQYLQIQDQTSISFLQMLIKEHKIGLFQSFLLFFDDQQSIQSIKMVPTQPIKIPSELQKQIKLSRVLEYFRYSIRNLSQIQIFKQKLVLLTKISYQNIFLLFSPSIQKKVILSEICDRFGQFVQKNIGIKQKIKLILIKYGQNLKMNVQVQKRNISKYFIKTICEYFEQDIALKTIDHFEHSIQSYKSDIRFMKQIFQNISSKKDGTFSFEDLNIHLSKNNVLSSPKELMLLMYRFTADYNSKEVKYTQFISELVSGEPHYSQTRRQ